MVFRVMERAQAIFTMDAQPSHGNRVIEEVENEEGPSPTTPGTASAPTGSNEPSDFQRVRLLNDDLPLNLGVRNLKDRDSDALAELDLGGDLLGDTQRASWVWESVSAYFITRDDLEIYLNRRFYGGENRRIQVVSVSSPSSSSSSSLSLENKPGESFLYPWLISVLC